MHIPFVLMYRRDSQNSVGDLIWRVLGDRRRAGDGGDATGFHGKDRRVDGYIGLCGADS